MATPFTDACCPDCKGTDFLYRTSAGEEMALDVRVFWDEAGKMHMELFGEVTCDHVWCIECEMTVSPNELVAPPNVPS